MDAQLVQHIRLQARPLPVFQAQILYLPTAQPRLPEQIKTGAVQQRVATVGVGVKVQSVDEVEWPNSCLGVSKPSEACLQVIVPGYRVVFSTAEGTYEAHTDANGMAVRITPGR